MFHRIPPHLTPDRGFCVTVCNCKINDKISLSQQLFFDFAVSTKIANFAVGNNPNI